MGLRRELVERICNTFPDHVEVAQQRMRTRSILLVDNSFYVAVLLCRRIEASSKPRLCRSTHWIVSPNPSECGCITLVCRLNAASDRVISFHVFRRIDRIFLRCREDDPWLARGRQLNGIKDFYRVVTAIHEAAA